jgi:alpha-L-rhamnosidase
MIEKGATTVWELWNGDTADPAMNSGNHVMLVGDFIIWLYEDLAGVKADPAQPGFKHILMQPHPVGDLKFVKASHRSPYGIIRSEWQRKGDKFFWSITVPPNSTATVHVPSTRADSITESGQPAAKAEGVTPLGNRDGAAIFRLQSGRYAFTSTFLPSN